MTKLENKAAPRNRTLRIDPDEVHDLRIGIAFANGADDISFGPNALICGDVLDVIPRIEKNSIDLMFADPPYNLDKDFGDSRFKRRPSDEYRDWIISWLSLCLPALKPTASVYICGDWRSAAAIQSAGSEFLIPRNRITWEREKGRGAKANWKNSSEDIWFFTKSNEYTFNTDAVKQRRRVIAPYRVDGKPKDWDETSEGKFRDTYPSNIWTDISVPFWSMPENTVHPTQKPEKLLAKIILASSNPGALVFDPFAGSGTTAVVAKKLGRSYIAVESNELYCLLAQKRLRLADADSSIQGFTDGVFWERNSGK